MRGRLFVFLVWAHAIFFVGPCVSRDLTLADALAIEDIGQVAFDPTGRRIVFERIPPYGGRVSYAVGNSEPRYSAQLYVKDVEDGSPARPLLLHAPAMLDGMWMAGFSPSGMKLAVVWLEQGAARLGVFDFQTNSLRQFSFTPDLGFLTLRSVEPVWPSDEELIMPALSDGRQPITTGLRQAAARHLEAKWEEAFKGSVPTADVLESFSGRPPPRLQSGSLLKLNTRTGAVKVLSEGRFLDLRLSPDRRYLVANRIAERRQYDPQGSLSGSNGLVGFYRHEAVLFDLGNADALTPMCPGFDVADEGFSWGYDGLQVAFFAWPEGSERDNGTFRLFDISTKQCQAVNHDGIAFVRANFDVSPKRGVPFANGLAVPARTVAEADAHAGPSRRIDWYWIGPTGDRRCLTAMAGNVSSTLTAVTKQALFVEADGALRKLSDKGSRVVLPANKHSSIETVKQIGSSIVAQLTGGHRQLIFIDPKSGRYVNFTPTESGGEILAVSPASTSIVRRVTEGLTSSLVLSRAHGKDIPFWSYNTQFTDIQKPRKVILHYKVAGHGEMAAAAFLPNGLIAGRRAPIVVFVYPGPMSKEEWQYLSPYDVELFTSLGYVVLYPDAPESDLRTADKNPLGGWSSLVLPAIDAAVNTGYADPTRLAVYGVSQGSWSVLALLAQTNRFGAAFAGFGAANFTSAYGAQPLTLRMWPNDLLIVGDAYRFENNEGQTYPDIGSAPWDDPLGYVRASPIFSVKQIATPLLLVKSDFDTVGGMEEFDQMFGAMLRLRKEAQYVRYWGEAHGLSSPANIRDLWSRALTWFDQHLDIQRNNTGEIAYSDRGVPESRQGKTAADLSAESPNLQWFFFGTELKHH